MARKMKKLTKLHVSTFAERGSVLVMKAYLGPITAPRIILTACPPQYVWIPILHRTSNTFPVKGVVSATYQMQAVTILFSTGQNPPIIPQELKRC